MTKGKENQVAAQADPSELEEASVTFVGRWNRLVSTTNWEKGKIISEWRTALQAAEAPRAEYSDEAWSRRVGSVSPQHVGRLRRVYKRFSETWNDYEGLHWSHFCSALDWSDAEMWLEGAVQNHWSVSQMRHQRWEALGAPPDLKPSDSDIISAEIDEDFTLELAGSDPADVSGKTSTVRGLEGDESFEPDFGAETDEELPAADDAEHGEEAKVRPFAELAKLPDDLAEAFESFKLAILRHKMDGWTEITRDDVLSTLEALKELALAP